VSRFNRMRISILLLSPIVLYGCRDLISQEAYKCTAGLRPLATLAMLLCRRTAK
jgi:hypothetical protein